MLRDRDTQYNTQRGEGNVDLFMSVRQQASVELSKDGYIWLNAKLDEVFKTHGVLSPTGMNRLDWPKIVVSAAPV